MEYRVLSTHSIRLFNHVDEDGAMRRRIEIESPSSSVRVCIIVGLRSGNPKFIRTNNAQISKLQLAA